MESPMSKSVERKLSTNRGDGGATLLGDRLEFLRALAIAIQTLHAKGLVHREISQQQVDWDSKSAVVSFRELSPVVSFGGRDADRERTPPSLMLAYPIAIPVKRVEGQQVLSAEGIEEPVEQIDFYQFGSLACRLWTGESLESYLRGAQIEKVPLPIRAIVDRALGLDPDVRFRSAAELVAAMKAIDVGALEASDPSDVTAETVLSDMGQQPDTSSPESRRNQSRQETTLPFEKLGHYELLSRIGRGGMGDVYLGYERSLDRKVAIKVLPADLARDQDLVRRFYAEATAAARVTHPNVIPIHYIGEDQGSHFFAMQYIEGESLAALLSRRVRLTVEETLDLIGQVLAGLGAAHRQGLIHRDIKPANILLDRVHQRAVLADFGLVKSLQEAERKTATGVVMGTVDYLSPEQGQGRPVDHRSDLYSLGVLLYRMLSGRLPFTADSPTALIFQHVYEQPRPLHEVAPEVPEALGAIVAKLLAKAPQDRHTDAAELQADLAALRGGQPTRSRMKKEVRESDGSVNARTTIVARPSSGQSATVTQIEALEARRQDASTQRLTGRQRRPPSRRWPIGIALCLLLVLAAFLLTRRNRDPIGSAVPAGKPNSRPPDAATPHPESMNASNMEAAGSTKQSETSAPQAVATTPPAEPPSTPPAVDSTPPEPLAAPPAATSDGKRIVLGEKLPSFLRTKGSYRRSIEGGIVFEDGTPVLTTDGTFLTKDFTLEVLLALSNDDQFALVGLGNPRDTGTGEPMNSVTLRLDGPKDQDVVLARNSATMEKLGKIAQPGTHLVRMVKAGVSVTFEVDVNNDGPSADDMQSTIPNIKEYASFLNDQSTFLFIAGGGRFLEMGFNRSGGRTEPVDVVTTPDSETTAPKDGKRIKLGGSLPAFLRTDASFRGARAGGIILDDRTPVLTTDGTFLTRDFTFEVLLALADGDQIAFVGIGNPTNSGYGEPLDTVNLRIHSPNFHKDVLLAKNTFTIENLGKIDRPGTHLVRLTKAGDSVTFEVDVNNDGPSDEDVQGTIPNIREQAPFLHDKNAFLYFAGSGRFLEVSVKSSTSSARP